MNTLDTAPLRERIHALLAPASASAILDLGRGRGTDLLRIGGIAPRGARLVGVDASAEGIEQARAAAGDDPRYAFLAHDIARGLPFGDAEFDRVLSVNLLECVAGKEALLAEVHRVLRPDGIVVFAHFDWDSQLIDGEDKALVRRIVHAFGDLRQAWMADSDAWMGRRLWRAFQASGRFDGAVHPVVLTGTRFEPGTYAWESIHAFRTLVRRGIVSPEEFAAFLRDVQDLAARDEFLYSVTMFIYAGRKRAAPGHPSSG